MFSERPRPTDSGGLSALGTTHKYRWDSRYGIPYSVQASFASSVGTYGNRRQNTDASSRDSEEETSGDVVGIAAHRLPFAPHKSRRAAPLINRPLIPINTRRQLCLEKQIDNQGVHLETVRRFQYDRSVFQVRRRPPWHGTCTLNKRLHAAHHVRYTALNDAVTASSSVLCVDIRLQQSAGRAPFAIR